MFIAFYLVMLSVVVTFALLSTTALQVMVMLCFFCSLIGIIYINIVELIELIKK